MRAARFSPLALGVALIAGAASPPAAAVPAPGRPGTRSPALADSFPHARHGRLFTACGACHAGIASGDSARARPAPEFCASCHDGSLARRVDWRPSPPRATNLRYDHRRHAARIQAAGDSALACVRCHASAADAEYMNVGPARPGPCRSCHAPGAEHHLAQATCAPCHVPLREATGLSAVVIGRFPKPPSHDSGFVFVHAAEATSATCAVCHARDFCASCHLNAATVDAIRGLPSDPRVATLVRNRRVTYPKPPFHEASGFLRVHGIMARADVTGCGNCHARESCMGCHRAEERVAPVNDLPRRTRGGARGVDLSGVRPPDHAPDHLLRHRVPAAGGDASCSRCHAPTFCASCHDGATSPRYHGADFVQRHAESAYARENDCATCHQTEAFCRDCHRSTGLARTGAPVGRFHDAQPMWVFGHGGAARRAIESCAGCHAQSDCLRCHSASLGWRVNPHGRGFDADLQEKNPAMCRQCHLGGAPRR